MRPVLIAEDRLDAVRIQDSRNLLFQSGRQMDEVFEALIDRSRAPNGGCPLMRSTQS
jgi:hypothetical protein